MRGIHSSKLLDTKMKLHNSILIRMCLAAVVVLSLATPVRSNGNLQVNDSGPVGSNDGDFVVKFKGEIFSWKNLTDLLRQHNVTIPQENEVLAEVLQQKDSSVQSCQGRCFMDERSEEKTCYCDKACKTFGDCCLDFPSKCDPNGNANDGDLLPNTECEETNPFSWSGVIMQSSCSLLGDQDRNECQTVQQLNLTIQNELPVYDWTKNLTYRSIACARCNGEGNLTFWGLNIECAGGSWVGGDIKTVKTFIKNNSCTWKYAPLPKLKQRYKSCVHQDTQCTASNQLPVMSVIKELCSSYSMTFLVEATTIVKYRNPHCVLCNPEGKRQPGSSAGGAPTPPWSILLDVSSNIAYPKDPKNPQSTGPSAQGDKDPNEDSSVLIYITLICTVLSIISLCFLFGVYLMFEELRNLPGKCLINLSLALLCYQTIFLSAAKSKKIDVACKAVAIFLHFFILAAFSWMCTMAFDTANAFSVKGGNTRRQPSDVRKTFIKYCIVGWGLPAMIVALCSVLDFSGTLHFGYGL